MSGNGPPAEATDTGASDHADVVALPPLVYLAGLVSGLIVQWALGGTIAFVSAFRLVAGVVAVALGIVGSLRFARSFASTGQHRNPRTPTPSIISDGLFARSRNPAYVSLTLLYVGIALLLDNVWMIVFLAPILVLMHYGVILREEAYLEEKFGDEYRAYKAKVRRWI